MQGLPERMTGDSAIEPHSHQLKCLASGDNLCFWKGVRNSGVYELYHILSAGNSMMIFFPHIVDAASHIQSAHSPSFGMTFPAIGSVMPGLYT